MTALQEKIIGVAHRIRGISFHFTGSGVGTLGLGCIGISSRIETSSRTGWRLRWGTCFHLTSTGSKLAGPVGHYIDSGYGPTGPGYNT